jgi:hypothetical protein
MVGISVAESASVFFYSIFFSGTVSFIACICGKHFLRIVDSDSDGLLKTKTVCNIH